MIDPKDKKKKQEKDIDFTDEIGGGATADLTEKGFLEALDKVITTKKPKSKRKSPDAGKSKTSE